MSTSKRIVNNVPLYLMKDDQTGRTRVLLRRITEHRYLGELFEQVRDDLHLHLCELNPGIEVWEPDRQWPWKTHHTTVDTEREALSWLLYRAHKRGVL